MIKNTNKQFECEKPYVLYVREGMRMRAVTEIQVGTMKYCPDCEKWKSRDEFFNEKRSPDGKCSYCKECSYVKNRKNIALSLGYGDWDPLRLIDNRRYDMNFRAMAAYNHRKTRRRYLIKER